MLSILKNTFYVLWFSVSAILASIFLLLSLVLFAQSRYPYALILLAITASLVFSAVKAHGNIPFPKMNSTRRSDEYHRPSDPQSEPTSSHSSDSFKLKSSSFRYDMDTLEGINAIPVPAQNYDTGDWTTDLIYYILQRKATEHKRNGRMDLAIACLRKSNALSDYEDQPTLSEKDYMRLVKYLKAAGDSAGAEAELAAIRHRHPEFYDKRISNLRRIKETIQQAKAYHEDLVYVTTRNDCPICSPYDGKIFSISGRSLKYPKLPIEFSHSGGFCPDCIVGMSIEFQINLQSKTSSPQSLNTFLSYSVPSQTKNDSERRNSSSLDDADWNISVSFGESSSQNYHKALTLARSAPQYHEYEYEDTVIHQATYSASPKDYLAFIMLYELVSDWKSSFVFINGQPIDRKIISQLNYCYGDKCRSTDPRYCFGASYMTENPFGCHRIQISAANHPWWSYYRTQGNKYVLNIDEMLPRIYSAESKYSCCPCFDLDSILDALYKLPRTLTQRQMDDLRRDNFGQRM